MVCRWFTHCGNGIVLPAGLSFYMFLAMIVVMGFIPVIYSYLEFKKMT